LLESTAVLLALGTVVFFALRLLPGDPALLMLGDHASAEERARVVTRLHLDESLPMQYARFLGGLLTLNLGESLRYPGVPAFARVWASMGKTTELAVLAVALGAVFGVSAGLLGVGPWLGRARTRVSSVLDALASLPLLSFGPIASYVFAVKLGWVPLPGDPEASVRGLLFAAVLLALPLGAHLGRNVLALLRGVESAPFLRVVQAKGGAPGRVWIRHALPTVSGPVLTVIATQLGALLGGAVVVERLFERPGLGLLVLEAYAARDIPVLEASVVTTGAIFVAVQTFGAFAHRLLDPRPEA
jgi:peptide/nickel transport system permease protein